MSLKRFLFLSPLMLWATAVYADTLQPERVVELFTSQGCSSCPPANIFVGQMASDETLVLSYGVTYWDYLGWKDSFAKPEFTRRQKIYARAFDSANVYTPQMILNGAAHGARYTSRDVKSMDLPLSRPGIHFKKDGSTLKVVSADDKAAGYEALLVEYVTGPQSVPVDAGENRGRVLTLTNVVTNIKALGTWSGKTLDTQTQPRSGKSYALLLHEPGSMKLVTAIRYTE